MTHGIAYGANSRREFLPYMPRSARSFLDVGCAQGGWLTTVRQEFGPDVRVAGVEATPEDAQAARDAGFPEVVTGYFPQALDQLEGRFDVVTFWDVLEHFVEPWDALRALAPRLSPDGVVVASIPNIAYLPALREIVLRGRFPYSRQGGIFDLTHVRFFTRASMIEMFEDCGYEVLGCEGAYDVLELGRYRLLKPLKPILKDWRWVNFVVTARPHGGEPRERTDHRPVP